MCDAAKQRYYDMIAEIGWIFIAVLLACLLVWLFPLRY
jgi:uncharacterized membrane protein